MQVQQMDNNFLIRLQRGEKVMESLLQFSKETQLEGAILQGLGAVTEVTLGYFEWDKKEYRQKTFSEIFEMLSLLGNLTRVEGEHFWHLHASLADSEYRSFGGHFFEATVTVTAELVVTPLPQPLIRSFDDTTRLNLWDLSRQQTEGE
ncbi:MAG: PPC domain-containing DNA-binding protein [Calditrichia bacterium]